MKNFYLLLLSCIFFFTCSSAPHNALTEMNVKGKGKQIVTHVYDAEMKFGELTQGEKNYASELDFDDKGNLLATAYIDRDSQVRNRSKCIYDAEGLLVRQETYHASGVKTSEVINEYNGSERKVTFSYKGEIMRISHEKIKNNIIVESVQYDSSGKELHRTKNHLKGTRTTKTVYTDESGDRVTKFTYNNHDDPIRIETNDSAGNTFTQTLEYEYDNQGNWVRVVTYNDKEPGRIEERQITYF